SRDRHTYLLGHFAQSLCHNKHVSQHAFSSSEYAQPNRRSTLSYWGDEEPKTRRSEEGCGGCMYGMLRAAGRNTLFGLQSCLYSSLMACLPASITSAQQPHAPATASADTTGCYAPGDVDSVCSDWTCFSLYGDTTLELPTSWPGSDEATPYGSKPPALTAYEDNEYGFSYGGYSEEDPARDAHMHASNRRLGFSSGGHGPGFVDVPLSTHVPCQRMDMGRVGNYDYGSFGGSYSSGRKTVSCGGYG
ncbi:hypothetical protein Agub_g12657, partial [Astrephomene gubernaculifera]